MIESHNREGRLVACMYINKLSCSMREDYKLQKNMFKLSVKDKSRTNRGANPKGGRHVVWRPSLDRVPFQYQNDYWDLSF